jgi:hypothetical protein
LQIYKLVDNENVGGNERYDDVLKTSLIKCTLDCETLRKVLFGHKKLDAKGCCWDASQQWNFRPPQFEVDEPKHLGCWACPKM